NLEEGDRTGFTPMTVEETALGFIEVANETMARAIRQISVMRGYDIKEHVLACFGGAGGQHACSLARRLGISRVRIHRFAGILSAYGLGLADVVREVQTSAADTLSSETLKRLEPRFKKLEEVAIQELHQEGFSVSQIQAGRYLNLRYNGTSTAMMIQEAVDKGYETSFREAHAQEYGFDFRDREIVIDDLRVRAAGKAEPIERRKIERFSEPPLPADTMKTYFKGGWADTKVYIMDNLKAGHRIYGPALVMQDSSTIVVEPECIAEITEYGDMDMLVTQAGSARISTESDPVELSIFNNLFMSVAEQMGKTLQRTSISTNIKERLDFSCAVFDRHGNLIANAPHIPVHIGSMSEAVKKQIELLGQDLDSGDVIVTNDPNFGGTHLPDITVITPVFDRGEILFFLASRGHHADIGGITPGSIPPSSKTLAEEGVCIKSFKLVRNGVFQEQEIRRILGSTYEAMTAKGKRCISGCRNIEDNISDLKAQVAANNRGRRLLLEMAEHYGLEVVMAYMGHIRDNAERAVRQMLQSISLNLGLDEAGTVEATEYLDNGSPLSVRVTLDRRDGSAHFDFTGTGKELDGNLNCPPPVTLSAILYVLRSLVNRDIPLNSGCLAPITTFIPAGSFLAPSENAAVVAGNVETSNRIVDCILKAFKVAAGSQGTLNNLTFGDETFGYYETIGGGAGAGPDWDGQSAVHTHMSNTRITDPEILERRYPVLLRQFSIRHGSGGRGLHKGGNGLIREIEFLKPMQAAILSERRIYPPYGLNGGEPGQTGKNLLIKKNGMIINIGGKGELELEKTDRICIATPGGGGFGKVTG
ncbi:MAG TPA: hydantoinase B/oxoprolinase family protein, partial [Thermodesulfovibrionia bacterium]|nr:hydantoinase B/oxoprolinase family protein [Thermodesulfovibrionia bacterium]